MTSVDGAGSDAHRAGARPGAHGAGEGAATVADLLERLRRRHVVARRHARRPLSPDPAEPADLPLLLRLASTAVDELVEGELARLGHDLTLLDVEVLRRVRSHPRDAADLADYLGRSRQRLSAVLVRLEQAGLVEREASWRDRRCRPAALTDEGFDVLDLVDERLASVHGALADTVGQPGVAVLALSLAIAADVV